MTQSGHRVVCHYLLEKDAEQLLYRARNCFMVDQSQTMPRPITTRLITNFKGEVSVNATRWRAAPAKINDEARRRDRDNLTISAQGTRIGRPTCTVLASPISLNTMPDRALLVQLLPPLAD